MLIPIISSRLHEMIAMPILLRVSAVPGHVAVHVLSTYIDSLPVHWHVVRRRNTRKKTSTVVCHVINLNRTQALDDGGRV
jgi:hypothetical protein